MDSARIKSGVVLHGVASSAIEAALQANADLVSTSCVSTSSLYNSSALNEELNSSARSLTVELRSSSGTTEVSTTSGASQRQTGSRQRRVVGVKQFDIMQNLFSPPHKYRPKGVPLFASARWHGTLSEIICPESHGVIRTAISNGFVYELLETPPPGTGKNHRESSV